MLASERVLTDTTRLSTALARRRRAALALRTAGNDWPAPPRNPAVRRRRRRECPDPKPQPQPPWIDEIWAYVAEIRMECRRLSNAFCKTLENLKAAMDVHFTHYDLGPFHRSLRCTRRWRPGGIFLPRRSRTW